jgi:hypothetical protein
VVVLIGRTLETVLVRHGSSFEVVSCHGDAAVPNDSVIELSEMIAQII